MKRPLILFFGLLAAACQPLKEGYGIEDPGQWARVYIAAAYSGTFRQTVSAGAYADLNIYANYSGLLPLAEDLGVDLAADEALVAPYNEKNGSACKILPATHYELTGTAQTIPAGSSIASAPTRLRLDGSAFADGDDYLLPVKISALSRSDIRLNEELSVLYAAIRCEAGTLSVSFRVPGDFTVQEEEKW